MKTKWLSQGNSKLNGSSVPIVSWGLPAGKTCLFAGACRSMCYAQKRRYKFASVVAKREENLRLAKSKDFKACIRQDLIGLPNGTYVRIHDSGDFFSEKYLRDWMGLMNEFPGINFYAYTKAVPLLNKVGFLPANFRAIFSLGGTSDQDVNICSHRHARIFDTLEELLAAGYVDGSKDDGVAATSKEIRIGLVRKK